MSRRFRWALAAALCLAAIGGIAFSIYDAPPDRVRSGGPVGNRARDSVGTPGRFGQTLASGIHNIMNYGSEVAVIEKIEPVNPSPGIVVKAVRLAGGKRGMVPAIEEWPSSDFRDLHPIAGYRLEPVSTRGGLYGAGVIFTFEPELPGRYVVPGFDVTYRVAGKRYRDRVENPFALCSTRGSLYSPKPCEPPE